MAALAAPRGDLRLATCQICDHVFNTAFQAQRMEYGGAYENSLQHSPHFRNYARNLAGYLLETYDLRGKMVLEIGCGQGDFLSLLCSLGKCRGVGFDPAYDPGRSRQEKPAQVGFVRDFYSSARIDSPVDFVCCRQVLEHLADPVGFLQEVRASLGDQPVPVFFEVPNALYTFRRHGVWDLIYEHPSFFGAHSLSRLFTGAGFRLRKVREAFAGQYLWLEAVAANDEPACPPPAIPAVGVERFREELAGRLAFWRRRLTALHAKGERLVIWGAGSKGVTFLNLLEVGDEIPRAVDINPNKQGNFLPGTGQPIVAPEDLVDQPPDRVLVMNSVYSQEIARRLHRLGLSPALEPV